MQRFKLSTLLFLLSSFVLTACHRPSPAEKIVGIWTIDADESLNNDPNIKRLKGEKRAEALKLAKQVFGQMSFEFDKDKQIKMTLGLSKQEGSYEILKVEGNTLTLKTLIKREQAGDKVEEDQLLVEILGKKLRITGSDKQTLIFVKKIDSNT